MQNKACRHVAKPELQVAHTCLNQGFNATMHYIKWQRGETYTVESLGHIFREMGRIQYKILGNVLHEHADYFHRVVGSRLQQNRNCKGILVTFRGRSACLYRYNVELCALVHTTKIPAFHTKKNCEHMHALVWVTPHLIVHQCITLTSDCQVTKVLMWNASAVQTTWRQVWEHEHRQGWCAHVVFYVFVLLVLH